MKKVFYQSISIVAVIIAFSFMMSCSQQAEYVPSKTELDNAEAKASEATQKIVDLLAEDNSEALSEYLSSEDPSGEVSALVDNFKIEQSATPKDIVAFPGFNSEAFKNGDVLVFQGSGESWQSNLMSLVLLGTFGHGGVLDKEMAIATGNVGCVLSATIEENEDGSWTNGLCLQDQDELVAGSVAIGRFEVEDVENPVVASVMESSLAAAEWRIENLPSLYAFLHLNLDPVTRDDEYLWYCSKVAWRFYNDYFSSDIEDTDFYFEDNKWTALRETTLYKVYFALLDKFLPARWAKYLADKKLKVVLAELITPDELWYWAQDNALEKDVFGTLTDYWAAW